VATCEKVCPLLLQFCLILDIHSAYQCFTNFICSKNPFTLKRVLWNP
jgi:hypothetical protein